MDRVEYNVQTGESAVIPLTPEEIAAAQAATAAEIIANQPKIITKLGFVRWAKANNHYASLIALLNSDTDLMFEWNAASELSINDPLVIGAAATLGLDAQAVFNEIGQ